MARTKKDILVLGKSSVEVKSFVQNWFAQNKIRVIDNQLIRMLDTIFFGAASNKGAYGHVEE